MIRSNLDAEISAKQMQLQILEKDLERVDNLIRSMEQTKQHILKDRSDILFEIEDLKDQMEDD